VFFIGLKTQPELHEKNLQILKSLFFVFYN